MIALIIVAVIFGAVGRFVAALWTKPAHYTGNGMKVAYVIIIRVVMVTLAAAFALDVLRLVGLMSGPGPPVVGNRDIPARDLPRYTRFFVTLLVMLVILPVLFVVASLVERRLSRLNREAEPPAA